MKFLNLAFAVSPSLITHWKEFRLDEFDASAKYQCKSQHTKHGNEKEKKNNLQKEGEGKKKEEKKEEKRVQLSHMLSSSIIIQLLESIHLARVQNLSLEAQRELQQRTVNKHANENKRKFSF